MKPTILFVDDEASILKALKRQFRKHEFNLLFSQSGADGLTQFEANDIDLVISDMKMPQMDGAEFLSKVKEISPDTVRILLTGYSDMDATVRAINDAGIFGYLSKPWESSQLEGLINSALTERLIQRKKQMAVASVIQERESLKSQVEHQKREMAMADRYVQDTYQNLQEGYSHMEDVLVNLLNLRDPRQRLVSHHVCLMVEHVAEQLCMNEKDKELLQTAAKLHAIGKISLPDDLLRKPLNSVLKSEYDRYLRYPVDSACALMTFKPYQEVSKVITLQKAYLDGTGTTPEKGCSDLSIYSRILCVCIDYVDFRLGIFDNYKHNHESAIEHLEKQATRYDERLIALLSTVTMGVSEVEEDTEIRVPVLSLKQGMILSKNIYTTIGTLLLTKNTSLSETVIDQLQRIQRNTTKTMVVSVRFPSEKSIQSLADNEVLKAG